MTRSAVPDRDTDFAADPVELFFDLAYVFAFSQLVTTLIDEPNWQSVGRSSLLFVLLWLPWQQFTWSANTASGSARTTRIVFLAATAISVPMAASVSTAFDAGGPVLAVCLAMIMSAGFFIQTRYMERGTIQQRTIRRWIAPNTATIALLVAGSLTDGTTRIVVWTIAATVAVAATLAAGRGDWILRPRHMAERHGLIVIVALGEVIVAIGVPVVTALETTGILPATSLAALAGAGLLACLLWWCYFDRPSPALEHHSTGPLTDNERARYIRTIYTWTHAPLVAGIILAAAGLEEAALHPNDPIPTPYRAMLATGLALNIAAIVVAIWLALNVIAWERIALIATIGTIAVTTANIDAVYVIAVLVAGIVAAVVVEHMRVEQRAGPADERLARAQTAPERL